MKSLTAAACSLFLITFGADAAAGEGWRADLPWAILESKLSTSASLIDTGFKDYASECTPEFVNFRSPIRSTYALIDQPSGLCLPHLACGYDRCNPRPSANHTYDLHAQDTLAMAQEVAVPDAFNPARKIVILTILPTQVSIFRRKFFILSTHPTSLRLFNLPRNTA